jgi:hypothetical protein
MRDMTWDTFGPFCSKILENHTTFTTMPTPAKPILTREDILEKFGKLLISGKTAKLDEMGIGSRHKILFKLVFDWVSEGKEITPALSDLAEDIISEINAACGTFPRRPRVTQTPYDTIIDPREIRQMMARQMASEIDEEAFKTFAMKGPY